MKSFRICCILLLLSLLAVSSAIAGSVTMNVNAVITSSTTESVTTHLDFGTIDLDPAGDTITIAAASGAATPVATGASVITGSGTSGLITIATAVIMNVKVTYPASDVTLSSGTDSLTITSGSIASNSMYPDSGSGGDTNGTTDFLIHVGGAIVIPSGQASGTYTGTMSLTINYS